MVDTSFPTPPEPPIKANVKKVPFVELHGGRLQGVVSSGSDVARVYCAFIEAGTGNYYSSTNNNRPDAGMAKRLRMLADQAVAQYGEHRVLDYLGVPDNPGQPRGQKTKEQASEVFSRFLDYLRTMEHEASTGPVPEMTWFVSDR